MAAAHKLDADAAEVKPDANCDFGFTSGYRPQLFIDGGDCDVEIMLDTDRLDPGDSGIVYGRFFRPELNLRKLTVGKAVLLREGSRTIGYGTLLWRRTSEQADEAERKWRSAEN